MERCKTCGIGRHSFYGTKGIEFRPCACFSKNDWKGHQDAKKQMLDLLEKAEERGKKFDGEKPRMNLLFQEVPYALEQLARSLQLGEDKYGRGNWRDVENKEDRYLAALLRHLVAIHKGEKTDPESGLSHLAHVACNAMFLLDNEVSKQ